MSISRLPKPGTSLADRFPEIALEADGWDPTLVASGSNAPRSWRCSKGHKWSVSPNNRTQKGTTGCPFCAGKRVIAGVNDLQTQYPEIAAQADGWNPETFHAKSNKRMQWRCLEGHSWSAAICDRVEGDDCSVCSNRVLQRGHNDLKSTHPLIALQADGWDPSNVIDGSHSRQNWICGLGHKWTTTVKKRISGQGCPFCSGQRVLKGFNDLKTLNPVLASEAYGWDPTTVTIHSGIKQQWRCDEGHLYYATPDKRSNLRGCPSCSATGFSPHLEGWLYLLEHTVWNLFQIGITNYPENRLSSHKKLGWEVVDIRGPSDGHLTRQLETDALRMLAARGAVFANDTDIAKFDGWSESWTRTSLPVQNLANIISLIYEDEVPR